MVDGLAEGWPKVMTWIKTWQQARQRASDGAGQCRKGMAKRTQGQTIVEGRTGARAG